MYPANFMKLKKNLPIFQSTNLKIMDIRLNLTIQLSNKLKISEILDCSLNKFNKKSKKSYFNSLVNKYSVTMIFTNNLGRMCKIFTNLKQ